jgi:hypothetical protein
MPLVVFASTNVLLPGREEPVAAIIEIDSDSGKFIAVHEGARNLSDYKSSVVVDAWHDVGDKWILPGLVECLFVYKLKDRRFCD